MWRAFPQPLRAAHDSTRAPTSLGKQLARDSERIDATPRHIIPPLWVSTLSSSTKSQFVQHATMHLAAGRDLRTAVEAAAPLHARLHGVDGAERREQLQCVLLTDIVTQRLLPLPRIGELWYPHGAFDPTLHFVPEHKASALRRLQRAALYRLFQAQLDARRMHAAACVLHDRRLRPSQPKHLLALLLRRTAQLRGMSPLSIDPQQSARAALGHACAAIVARPPPAMRAPVAVAMLEQLAALHLHAALLEWARVLACIDMQGNDPGPLARVAWRLCRSGAHATAYAYVQALPVEWRTRSMYTALLAHYGDALLDANGEVSTRDATPSAVLWRELCTTPHLAPPDAPAYVARLASHARHARALHALRDERAMHRRCMPDVRTREQAALHTLRALLAAGRWSLAVRHARRHVQRHGAPAHAATWLNAMIASLVSAPTPRMLPPSERAHLLSCLYRHVLRPDEARSARRLPPTETRTPTLAPLVEGIAQFALASRARPDRTTLLLLVRAAAQWDESLDSRALWHMAHLVLPEGHLHTPADTPRTANGALLVELAAAFARRADHRSARSAQFLARQGRRRVRRSAGAAPRALPPHRL